MLHVDRTFKLDTIHKLEKQAYQIYAKSEPIDLISQKESIEVVPQPTQNEDTQLEELLSVNWSDVTKKVAKYHESVGITKEYIDYMKDSELWKSYE
jgi:hypothetical protein